MKFWHGKGLLGYVGRKGEEQQWLVNARKTETILSTPTPTDKRMTNITNQDATRNLTVGVGRSKVVRPGTDFPP